MRNSTKIIDITGQKFNKLTVIGIASRNPLYWRCKCECGNEINVRTSNLKRGLVKSCGCIHHRGNPIHNYSNTRLYRIRAKMIRRCFVKEDPAYPNYGGRGISMCADWKNSVSSFVEWALANGYSDSLTIDRIDNDGDYTPENCRWVDSKTQSNNRRSNINITIGGETKTLNEWCEQTGVPSKRAYARVKAGWDLAEAVTITGDARRIKRNRDEPT